MTKKTFQRQLVVPHPLRLVRTAPTESRAEIKASGSVVLSHREQMLPTTLSQNGSPPTRPPSYQSWMTKMNTPEILPSSGTG